jgi:hypothetical protein
VSPTSHHVNSSAATNGSTTSRPTTSGAESRGRPTA